MSIQESREYGHARVSSRCSRTALTKQALRLEWRFHDREPPHPRLSTNASFTPGIRQRHARDTSENSADNEDQSADLSEEVSAGEREPEILSEVEDRGSKACADAGWGRAAATEGVIAKLGEASRESAKVMMVMVMVMVMMATAMKIVVMVVCGDDDGDYGDGRR